MAKQTTKRKAGRPKANIDWDEVAKMLQAGCLVTEIAGSIGCDTDTIYTRCKKDLNMDFSAFKQQKRASGDRILRMAQYRSAVVDGDRGMQIWLGKQRLGQKDKHDVTSAEEKIAPSWTIEVIDKKQHEDTKEN